VQSRRWTGVEEVDRVSVAAPSPENDLVLAEPLDIPPLTRGVIP
jgi:hypothetical protein